MILTGPEIERQIGLGRIRIDPFDPLHVGPNSIDLHLAPEIAWYDIAPGDVLDPEKPPPLKTRSMSREGSVLQPGTLHLGSTVEETWTDHYIPILEGRSSIGRLGIKTHFTAGFGDIGFRGRWTLEIEVCYPTRLYPGMRICQLYFLVPEGEIRLYRGRYQGQQSPTPSRYAVPNEKTLMIDSPSEYTATALALMARSSPPLPPDAWEPVPSLEAGVWYDWSDPSTGKVGQCRAKSVCGSLVEWDQAPRGFGAVILRFTIKSR